jgi:hypothetical protein
MGAQEQVEVANRVLNLVFGLAVLAIIGVPVAIFMFRLSVFVGLIATLGLASFAIRLLLPVARALLAEQSSRRQ